MPSDKTLRTKAVSDSSYRYATPLKVQLEKGTHELEISVSEGRLRRQTMWRRLPSRRTIIMPRR